MQSSLISSSAIKDNILIPKYYNIHTIIAEESVAEGIQLISLGQLIDSGIVSVRTGDEPGKMTYGTGDTPFVRTSDISNWEIKTIPKQGVSTDVHQRYAAKQDTRAGDILLVKDGTYLIGTNCLVTPLDLPMLFQSHIIKLRAEDPSTIPAELLFAALNTTLVQQQIRAFQFTADIIDTIGDRYREIMLPIPRDVAVRTRISEAVRDALERRMSARIMVKQFPALIEQALTEGSMRPFLCFDSLPLHEKLSQLVSDTSALEFGNGSHYVMQSNDIADNILIPKYYNPEISESLATLGRTCDLIPIAELVDTGVLSLATGDEPGKMAYGTGSIPFVRTSDFANWEIKHDAKQGVSEQVYKQYQEKQDVRSGDVLVVRDGTYLVGTSCIVMPENARMLYCGGLIKVRSLDEHLLSPFLLLALLNSYVVKRQIRSKQFTRDVIDTMGDRFPEVVLPIPKDPTLRSQIAELVEEVLARRAEAKGDLRAYTSLQQWTSPAEGSKQG